MIQVGLFLPFKSDHWHSIERFAGLIQTKTPTMNSNIHIELIRPDPWWENWGAGIARRGIYTFSAAFEKFDVYHIADQSYSHILQFLPRKKVLITCHDLEFWRKRDSKNMWIRRWMATSLLNAGHVSTPTRIIQKELGLLAHEMQINFPNSTVIPNSCGDEFQKAVETDHLLAKWNPEKRPLLLNLANTAWPRKNFSFLIDLLKELKSQIPNILLIQVGPRWSEDHKNKIAQHGLVHHIKHFENLSASDVVEVYQAADLYLHPSTYEGFGYPLLETVACHTPFLASKIDVFSELLPDHRGLINLDLSTWTEKIKNLLVDSKLRNALLVEQTRILSGFSWKTQIQSYVKIYETVAKN